MGFEKPATNPPHSDGELYRRFLSMGGELVKFTVADASPPAHIASPTDVYECSVPLECPFHAVETKACEYFFRLCNTTALELADGTKIDMDLTAGEVFNKHGGKFTLHIVPQK